MRVGGQRMGGGINGCLNIVGWNFLFRPNSAAAQRARANCVDHWMRTGQGGQTSERPRALALTRSELQANSGQESNGTNKLIILAVVAVVAYIIYKS